jgi:hypothetical protein
MVIHGDGICSINLKCKVQQQLKPREPKQKKKYSRNGMVDGGLWKWCWGQNISLKVQF